MDVDTLKRKENKAKRGPSSELYPALLMDPYEAAWLLIGGLIYFTGHPGGELALQLAWDDPQEVGGGISVRGWEVSCGALRCGGWWVVGDGREDLSLSMRR